jgi:hypothetical protein
MCSCPLSQLHSLAFILTGSWVVSRITMATHRGKVTLVAYEDANPSKMLLGWVALRPPLTRGLPFRLLSG